ncbi:MAG TPA: divalent-cation tolerance protein CutA [Pirellulaceae bacterium]|nr:divalent-cation tolerance protein CutA [Pirellulaceae bacterium]
MTDFILIQTTTGTRHDAEQIAASLVGQRLAACVQIGGPIESTYHWEGVQQTSAEWFVSIKTRLALFTAVEQAILALHPYEQPEIIALPIVAINAGYAQWVNGSVREAG